MVWSTFIKGRYSQCVARANGESLSDGFTHLEPLISDDGGHGMVFEGKDGLMLTIHSPNKTNDERPHFIKIEDVSDNLRLL